MSRNAESRFALNPTNIDLTRSRFKRNSGLKTSFNVGDIIPIYVDEVLPGDTFDIKTNKVVRLQTPLTPFMDNLYLDTYYFFVPNRLVWEHWKQFNGENTQSAWIPTTTYQVPQITSPSSTGWNVGTIADYFGIRTGVPGLSVSALPFRAYALICNEFFRDENLCDPLNIPVNDTTVAGVNTGTFINDVAKGGLPYKAAKYHDYFTSCLPNPQKGPDVLINGAAGVNGYLPVIPTNTDVDFTKYGSLLGTRTKVNKISDGTWLGPLETSSDSNYNLSYLNGNDKVYFGNLWALNDSVSVNQLRLAFQLQKLYEKDARGGSRYIEILKSHFGVTSPDYRLQRPEYLGGNRAPINVNQVVQTSATASGQTAQGNVTAMSVTVDSHHEFQKSFTEHGFVIGLCVARYDHTYQQGIERMWFRKDRFDYYWPVLANIGEQAVKNQEIFATGTSTDTQVFGYQEAWADYRYKPNRVSGEMRSDYATSLDVWHLGDDYATLPTLSDSWIMEDKTNVDRVLAVKSSVSNQLFGDFYFENKTTRPMPLYSIPGLIDHH